MLLNRDGFESQEESAAQIARQCENAWEKILDFKNAPVAVRQET